MSKNPENPEDVVKVGTYSWSRTQTAGTPVGPLIEEIVWLRGRGREEERAFKRIADRVTGDYAGSGFSPQGIAERVEDALGELEDLQRESRLREKLERRRDGGFMKGGSL